ncbi:MAG: hypothetical protein GY737_19915, partial [Desulfobacteraceae bacterium]|nr:hypothetical protein [Desulfobacteraceae bacterium]
DHLMMAQLETSNVLQCLKAVSYTFLMHRKLFNVIVKQSCRVGLLASGPATHRDKSMRVSRDHLMMAQLETSNVLQCLKAVSYTFLMHRKPFGVIVKQSCHVGLLASGPATHLGKSMRVSRYHLMMAELETSNVLECLKAVSCTFLMHRKPFGVIVKQSCRVGLLASGPATHFGKSM